MPFFDYLEPDSGMTHTQQHMSPISSDEYLGS